MRSLLVIALLLALQTPAAGAAATPAPAPPPGSQAAAPRKVDVNRATAAELVEVPGLGERLAQAIVELRGRKGSFTRLDELLEVRGIGEKSLVHLSEHLTVGPATAQAGPAQPPAPKP